MVKEKDFSEVEFGVESLEMPGQPESGDLHVVKRISTGALIGVIDGLGHGVEAATAAKLAVKTVDEHSEESIINIAKLCNDRLKGSRGAVMALAAINSSDETLTWLSIGNVEGLLIRANPRASPAYENIFMRPGVVGYRLPPLFASVFSISRNDLLILSTDGINIDYSQRVATDVRYAEDVFSRLTESQIARLSTGNPVQKPAVAAYEFAEAHNIDLGFITRGKDSIRPKNLASFIIKNYAKGTDDALVLVAKYLGRK